MGISLVLLAYKEEDNLRVLLPQIIEEVEKCNEEYEILVVDTAKPLDNTKGVCQEYGARYINQEEPGFGGAFRTAIRMSLPFPTRLAPRTGSQILPFLII